LDAKFVVLSEILCLLYFKGNSLFGVILSVYCLYAALCYRGEFFKRIFAPMGKVGAYGNVGFGSVRA
jgi:hypothetical protein